MQFTKGNNPMPNPYFPDNFNQYGTHDKSEDEEYNKMVENANQKDTMSELKFTIFMLIIGILALAFIL